MTLIGGQTRQKIDINPIIELAVNGVRDIESDNCSQSEKTKKCARLAKRIKNALYKDGRRDERSRIAITTYKRYVSRVRNAIKDTGLTHHSLQSKRAVAGSLARVQRDHPEYAELLDPLKTAHARTIGALRNEILETVQADKKNKNRAAAYADIKRLSIDHETLRHLLLDEVIRADLKEQAQNALAKKKVNRVTVRYNDVLSIINDNLTSDSYTRAAYALALASGRRAIEILDCGWFEKTGKNTVMFHGQAKKQVGIDSAPYEIYTLIDSDEFISAFKRFKRLPNVVAFDKDFDGLDRDERNRLINGRTAKTLNSTAKLLMDDSRRKFKCSRSIYTRICLDLYHAKSHLANADEDVFAKSLLGHGAISTGGSSTSEKFGGDYTASLSYRQFVIDYDSEPSAKPAATAEPEPKKVETAKPKPSISAKAIKAAQKELSSVEKAIKAAVEANEVGAGIARYHEQVVEWRAENPDKAITVTSLSKKERGGIGGNRATVKKYVDIYNANI